MRNRGREFFAVAGAVALALSGASCTAWHPAAMNGAPVAAPLPPPDAAALLAQAEQAVISQERLAALKNAKLSYSISDQSGSVVMTIRYMAPDKYRFDLSSDKVSGVICVVGDHGWGYEPEEGLFTLSRKELDNLAGDIAILPFNRHLTRFFPSVALDGEETLDGTPCWIVAAAPDATHSGAKIRLWIDKLSKMVLKYELKNGDDVRTTRFYDYADFGGIRVARRKTDESNREGSGNTVLLSVEWDGTVGEDDFVKRAPREKP